MFCCQNFLLFIVFGGGTMKKLFAVTFALMMVMSASGAIAAEPTSCGAAPNVCSILY